MGFPVPVVRDVFDALGRMITTQPVFVDSSQLSDYLAAGWRLPFGAPVAPQTGQIPEIVMSPTDLRPWSLNWGPWLNGAVLTSSLWIPSDPLTVLSNESSTSSTTTTWITGGTAGGSGLLTNRITASDGREDDQSVIVVVQQR